MSSRRFMFAVLGLVVPADTFAFDSLSRFESYLQGDFVLVQSGPAAVGQAPALLDAFFGKGR